MKTRILILTALLSTSLVPSAQAAEPDNRTVVHDKRGQVVKNTFGYCVRTRWVAGSDECQAIPQAKKAERHAIADEERTVYFEFNKTRLMESEQHKLNSLATTLKSMDDITGVSVVGYADRIGTASYNERLSKQRAGTVEKYLRQRGYLKTTLAKTRWLGESAPITQCPDSLSREALVTCLQKDRRVTVEIKYRDDK